jgi:pentose-5-phosphate-3-epimerase
MRVSVDGGVNLNTVESIKRVGVQQLAAGSAIFKAENKEEAIRLLAA